MLTAHTVVYGTYDPETKSGSGFEGRKAKGTIHWVAIPAARQVECRLYENIVDEEKGRRMKMAPYLIPPLWLCFRSATLSRPWRGSL